MVYYARRKLLGEDGARRGTFHCTTRCVRRAYLCGQDPLTGQDYSYRRVWILLREEQLAGLFTIDIEFHSEMSNHLHMVLRPYPRAAKWLGAEEVARRWLTITKLAKCMSDELPVPDEKKVQELAKDKKRIKKLRKQLSSISWFMAILSENVARRANAEDGVKGRFWETRFKCRECADVSAILLCGIYVDLNPIKAGEVDNPRAAYFTSAYQRIEAQTQRRNARHRADGWLAELTLQPESQATETRACTSRTGRRASDMGILPISFDSYLRLLEWTARLIRSGERSTIPKDLAEILDRMNIEEAAWLDTVQWYDDLFGHVVGSCASMGEAAKRMETSNMKGTTASRRVFK